MSRERIMLTQAIPAVQQLRRVQGFDPLRFLKRNANGGIELEPRYQRLWFRLACPDGKMLLNRLRITDQIAVYEAQVFLSREDNQPLPILPRRWKRHRPLPDAMCRPRRTRR